MVWQEKDLAKVPKIKRFRMRGVHMTRLETFLDAAFAFATTMLVISVGTIPGNYQELILAIKGIPAFAASFFVIMTFWLGHRQWSRRYGLEDGLSTVISLFIMFIVLVYIYPLKLMFTTLFAWISQGWLPSEFSLSSIKELLNLFAVYGLGLASLASMMGMLYFRALKQAVDLQLDKFEMLRTREEIAGWVTASLVGLISTLMALFTPKHIAIFAGLIYIILPIIMPLISVYYDRKIRQLE